VNKEKYIYQQENWPNFIWNINKLSDLLAIRRVNQHGCPVYPAGYRETDWGQLPPAESHKSRKIDKKRCRSRGYIRAKTDFSKSVSGDGKNHFRQ